MLKTILMNNAVDMGYDELSQGAGFVNAYKAVKAVLEANYPRVYSTSILGDILSELGYTYTSVTYGETLQGTWFEPMIHIPLVRAGRTATRPLTVEGRGTYRLYSARLEHTETVNLCDIVLGVIEPLRIPYCSGDTLMFNVTTTTLYGHLVLDVNALKKYDYFEIELVYSFQYFETGGRTGNYSNTISASIVELAYWIDVNNDGVFAWTETARIMYDIRGANSLRIQIGDLEGQIREIEELAAKYGRVSPAGLPRYLVKRIGVSGAAYRGYVLSITVRTTDSRLLPVGLFIGDEAVVTIAPGESYYVNLAEQGFTWEIRSYEASAGELKATIVLKPPATAPRGVYTIVIGLNTATPVTIVGWIDAGVRVVFFEWYTTQVYTAVTIR